MNWYKCNTDGVAIGPDTSTCGGIFKNMVGYCIVFFVSPLEHHNSLFTKIIRVILEFEEAPQKNWPTLWIETDFLVVTLVCKSSNLIP